MSKRAYIAKVEIEIVVVAESEDTARYLARRAFSEESVSEEEFDLEPLSYMPAPYTNDFDLVHHDGDGDLTIEQASKLPGGWAHGEQPPVPPRREHLTGEDDGPNDV